MYGRAKRPFVSQRNRNNLMFLLRTALIVMTILIASAVVAEAIDCPRQDSLGTSRILTVDAQSFSRVGLKSFPDTLPLADHEVVLTFDDGPFPPTTKRVLAALAQECVRATFFLIGKSAASNPGLVKAMAAAGHTIGHHSWSHPNLDTLSTEQARENINRGIAADDVALYGTATNKPRTPFFRFPFFASTPELLDELKTRDTIVFGADLWASDWNRMSPRQELELITARLQEAHKGIILFHDTKAQTAAMMPDFLRYLRNNGFHIVHIAPKP
jgi:peptidoglycan/xylan/chitin deacetylase (PgdA/CDA1 family)